MPRSPRKRLLIPLTVLPVVAAGLVAMTQMSASAATNPGPGFPAHFAAPYAEMWNSPSTLMAAANATGHKYYTLAFVISQGTCNATIDGDTPITDPGWNTAINNLRAAGGDVIVSFGGASGSELTSCTSVATLQAQYKRVVDQFNLTMIDLDIEGATLNDTAANDRRNTALANLQRDYAAAGRTLKVNYTLPVNPTGLEANSLSLLTNAKSHNLTVNLVNIMTMDYGPAMDMGQAAISAAQALHTQLGQIWTTKSPAELWAMEGNTPMIGVNDTPAEIFTVQDGAELEQFAAQNGIQLLAFWSLGADNSSSGTPQSTYQFTTIFKQITGGSVPPPGGTRTGAITGVGGKCIDVAAAGTANGTAVQLYDCNGSTAQQWTIGADGTIRSLGKCLDVTGQGTANGSKIQLWDCNGSGAQQWTAQSNGHLRNPQSGRDLDVPGGSSANGTRLQIWDTNTNAWQIWRLPA